MNVDRSMYGGSTRPSTVNINLTYIKDPRAHDPHSPLLPLQGRYVCEYRLRSPETVRNLHWILYFFVASLPASMHSTGWIHESTALVAIFLSSGRFKWQNMIQRGVIDETIPEDETKFLEVNFWDGLYFVWNRIEVVNSGDRSMYHETFSPGWSSFAFATFTFARAICRWISVDVAVNSAKCSLTFVFLRRLSRPFNAPCWMNPRVNGAQANGRLQGFESFNVRIGDRRCQRRWDVIRSEDDLFRSHARTVRVQSFLKASWISKESEGNPVAFERISFVLFVPSSFRSLTSLPLRPYTFVPSPFIFSARSERETEMFHNLRRFPVKKNRRHRGHAFSTFRAYTWTHF